jgi:hypothetical protein
MARQKHVEAAFNKYHSQKICEVKQVFGLDRVFSTIELLISILIVLAQIIDKLSNN